MRDRASMEGKGVRTGGRARSTPEARRGEAGLRRGEIIALEWPAVDLSEGLLMVERSAWKGEVTETKGMDYRVVPTVRPPTRGSRDHPAPGGRARTRSAAKDIVLEEFAMRLPSQDPRQLFETMVDWARYAELFGYEPQTEMLYLDQPDAARAPPSVDIP